MGRLRSTHQVLEERPDLRGEALELLAAAFVGADEIKAEMPDPGGVELPDLLRHLARRADRRVALRGGTHVHGVADAERLGGLNQGALVAVIDASEKEMGGSKSLER